MEMQKVWSQVVSGMSQEFIDWFENRFKRTVDDHNESDSFKLVVKALWEAWQASRESEKRI
jgi:hypothetical protein